MSPIGSALPEEPPAVPARDVARLRENEEIRRPELAVVRGRPAHLGAHPEVPLEQGRKGAEGGRFVGRRAPWQRRDVEPPAGRDPQARFRKEPLGEHLLDPRPVPEDRFRGGWRTPSTRRRRSGASTPRFPGTAGRSPGRPGIPAPRSFAPAPAGAAPTASRSSGRTRIRSRSRTTARGRRKGGGTFPRGSRDRCRRRGGGRSGRRARPGPGRWTREEVSPSRSSRLKTSKRSFWASNPFEPARCKAELQALVPEQERVSRRSPGGELPWGSDLRGVDDRLHGFPSLRAPRVSTRRRAVVGYAENTGTV